MKCPACQIELPGGSKFCNECGRKLDPTCPGCAQSIPPDTRFCLECGYELKDPARVPHLNYNSLHSYTPKHLIDKVLTSRSAIEGERKVVTVMFADVAGFTSMGEKLDPEDLHLIMNNCFRVLMDEVHKYEGTINEFRGDGVMALFPGSADDAVQAAIALHAAIDNFNNQREQNGLQPIAIGVGLHIGDLMLGIIGNEDRLQGTVVADVVNAAARLEGLTRIYGSSISVSESILSSLKEPDSYNRRFVDKVRLKGKDIPVIVYEIFDGDPPEVVRLKVETKANFEEGLRLYYDRKFAEASVQFNQVLGKYPEDKAARIYLTRCATHMVHGVPEEWTGVENLTVKG